MDCLFCKIIGGEMASKKLYEDEKVVVIMDAFPNVDGHVLVIPKEHYEDFLAMPSELVQHIHELTKKLVPCLMDKMDVESLSFCVNYGTMQAIKHYHLHLLPNYGVKKKAFLSVDEVYEKLKDIKI